MFEDSKQAGERGADHQCSAEIRKNAGPADCLKRTVSQANVVNQKYADWQQPRAEKKYPGELLLCVVAKGDPGLKDREHQGQITKCNHMNVGVHFGAAIFEETSDGLKAGKNGLRISC